MTLVLVPGAAEHLGYKNVLMLHAEGLRRFCAEMTAEYGLNFDTTFLESYSDQRWWFLEIISDT